ncbi:uncharacterized protein SPPG_08457 [Spizellomyces punctatus DAOM BR117]|uniref:Uncharacterized protein n=1 Tax=Spizellomyces punctatus (strain DAOM BR117) TaxID=645134 RepID=A0A0L0H3N3_SPIPD|nr:uncharacterized protein SPPG_08457 [Spizellomyces punctatus DAOM BR117]KNC96065.1 hypothetical protein SPPG_08457 [Spizellomyces punctatus DAOM BR117]|eukprot:XP_016604105.1 hypothetical protein SPPG_08457 [Spizellomyces punctatus DAOM BR117]
MEADVQGAAQAQRALRTKGKGVKVLPPFNVGDVVRKYISGQGTDIKRRAKMGYFSEEKYEITAVVPNPHPNYMNSYKIKSVNTNHILPGLYPAWQLRLIPKEDAAGEAPQVEPEIEDDEEEVPEVNLGAEK